MLNARFLKCLCFIGQVAMAAIVFGQVPRGSFAFAPLSLNAPAATSGRARHQLSLTRSVAKTTSPPAVSLQTNRRPEASSLRMSEQKSEGSEGSSLPVFLDPGTKGGAVVLSLLLFVVPIVVYQVATGVFGVDEIEAGRDIGVGFSVITMLLWGASYIFRVATKDMTYAKQLKDYEDAVIAKRLEELDEDEVQALVEDIERDQF